MKRYSFIIRLFTLIVMLSGMLIIPIQETFAQDFHQILQKKHDIAKKLETPYMEEVFFVKYKEGTTEEKKSSLKSNFNAVSSSQKSVSENIDAIQVSSKEETKDKMLLFSLDTNVEYVEVSHLGEWSWTDNGTTTTPDDWNATNHWYYEDTKLPELWDDQDCATGGITCGGDDEVIVAVLDSGLGYEDSSLSYEYGGDNYSTTFGEASEIDNGAGTSINLWENTAEVGGSTGIDDDSNGICDDEHGVDFGLWYDNDFDGYGSNCSSDDAKKEGHPNDDHGHGTYVTGLIASFTDNGTSSVGSTHNITIMPLKISAPFSGPNSYFFYEAVYYAVDNEADVIQVSSGWEPGDNFLNDAVNYAYDNDVTVVAASGNGGGDEVDYPAAYSNVIAVGAVNSDGARSSYSDYGDELDIVAPVGEGSGAGNATWQQTLTCSPSCSSGSSFTSYSNKYGAGTSFAAPQVSAAAALIKQRYEDLPFKDMLWALQGTSTSLGSATYFGSGLLNLENLYNNIWSPWEERGATPGKVSMKTFNPGGGDRLYQAVRGTNQAIYTRFSTDGENWSSWASSDDTSGDVTMTVFNPGSGDRLYQAMRGTSNDIYTRYTTDGNNWSAWTPKGKTPGEITMVEFDPGGGSRLYQAVRGTGVDQAIYTRYTTDGENWSSWTSKGATPGEVTMAVYNPGGGDRLYQAVRGTNDGIYSRYTIDGENWSGWKSRGETPGNVTLTVFDPGSGDRLYQAVRGTNDRIYTRYTADGENWSGWTSNGSAEGDITMQVFNNGTGDMLYQAVQGSKGYLYTRSTADGIIWNRWMKSYQTAVDVTMVTFDPGSGTRLYQAMSDPIGYDINTRYLDQI